MSTPRMNMRIQFRTKVQSVEDADGTLAWQFINVPTLKRNHVDMAAARSHPKYGSYANSDLFEGMLARIRRDTFKDGQIRLDAIPSHVTVDTSGFLAHVEFSV